MKDKLNKHGWGNCPDETAIPYINKCRLFVENDDMFKNFRRDPEYGKILSGDSKIVGDIALSSIKKLGYLDNLKNSLEEIKNNDLYGNPYIHRYDDIGEINPSTLRYFNSYVEIKNLLKGFSPKKIVEIGGGYGGLCRIMSVFINFEEYIIVDLPESIKLAEKFINNYPEIRNRVKYISCEDLKSYNSIDDVDLFIADSSMAECDLDTQKIYTNKISKKSKYCYVIWNTLHLNNGNNEMNSFLSNFDSNFVELTSIEYNIKMIYINQANKI